MSTTTRPRTIRLFLRLPMRPDYNGGFSLSGISVRKNLEQDA
jgi:hypothetical protein